METIIEFFNTGIEHLSVVGDTLDSYWERVIYWCLIAYLKIKLWALESGYAVASGIMSSLGLSDAINAAWASLDSRMLDTFTYLRIPESLSMMLNAFVTRFVMGLMP